MLGEHGHILAAIPQRRHDDSDDVQAIQQVEPKPPGRGFLPQIAIGGGDHAHVDPTRGVLPDAAQLSVLEHSKHLGLGPWRELTDLVQEERPSLRLLEDARAVAHGAGECPAGVPEQLGFDQLVGQGGAIQRAEWPIPAWAAAMQCPRNQFFPLPLSPSISAANGALAVRSTARRTSVIALLDPQQLFQRCHRGLSALRDRQPTGREQSQPRPHQASGLRATDRARCRPSIAR